MGKILIVDDSVVDRLILKQYLANTAHEVIEVGEPEEALAKISDIHPDVVLLDIVMPRINGFEICRRLKRDEKLSRIPVVMVSAKRAKSDIFWAKKQGAEDYLTKPITPETLLQTIEKWIKGRQNIQHDG